MICSRCRRNEPVEGLRSCRDCRQRDRTRASDMRACEDHALYCMRVRDGLVKIGRSHDVQRRSKELCARVLRVWPGLGHLEA